MAAPRELDLTVTLDVAWKAWREHLHSRIDAGAFSPESARNYLSYAERMIDALGPDRACDSVEAAEIRAQLTIYLACGAAGRPVSANTAHMLHKAFAQLMKYADAQRWLRENPMRDVPTPRAPRRAPGPERAALTRPELDALIAAAKSGHGSFMGDRGSWVRDEIVIRLAGESGLRNADIRNLDLGDIDMDGAGNWAAQIRCGKGRKARTVPLTDACAGLIRDYIEQWRPEPGGRPDRRDDYHRLLKGDAQALLLNADRGRLNPATVSRIVGRCAKAALGRHYVPHGLRHTTGTLLARSGVDVGVVAHVLGHSDISVTSVYLDTNADEASAAVNRRKVGARSAAPKLPPGGRSARWPECGTKEGWNRHRREKGPKCMPCLMWKREDREHCEVKALRRELADRERRIKRLIEEIEELRGGHVRRRRRHGAAATYRWHLSAGQTPCTVCEEAHQVNLASREACGTRAGQYRHRDWGEPLCRACLDAVAEDLREHKGQRNTRLRGLCAACEQDCAMTMAGLVYRHGACPGGGLAAAVPDV